MIFPRGTREKNPRDIWNACKNHADPSFLDIFPSRKLS